MRIKNYKNQIGCQHSTLKKHVCKNKATHLINETYVCTVHGRKMKSHDTCSICLETMAPSTSIRLKKCDHYYHTSCLEKWCSHQTKLGSCPMCRHTMSSGDYFNIHRSTASTILHDISCLPGSQQAYFWDCARKFADSILATYYQSINQFLMYQPAVANVNTIGTAQNHNQNHNQDDNENEENLDDDEDTNDEDSSG